MIPTQKTNMEAANRIKHTKEQDTQRFLIPETQNRETIVRLYLAWCLIRTTFHLIETITLLFTTYQQYKQTRTRCYHRRSLPQCSNTKTGFFLIFSKKLKFSKKKNPSFLASKLNKPVVAYNTRYHEGVKKACTKSKS